MKTKLAFVLLIFIISILRSESLSSDTLNLVTIFTDSVITMGVKGSFLPSLFYKSNPRNSELICSQQDNFDKILYSYYTNNNEIVLDNNNKTMDTINIGDTIFIGFRNKMAIVKNISDYIKKPLDAFDEQYRRFVAVKKSYQNYRDVKNMIIVKEDIVTQEYMDKLISIAKKAGYNYIKSTLNQIRDTKKSN